MLLEMIYGEGGLQLGRTQEGKAKEARGICFQPGLQSHSIPSTVDFEALHVPSSQFTILHARPAKPQAFHIYRIQIYIQEQHQLHTHTHIQ